MYHTFDTNQSVNRHGTGLGLVISQKIVGLLGPKEKIYLKSLQGVGTKFTFHINYY